MSDLLNWFTEHESALSGIAALIAIIAGVAVVSRLLWTRMPGVKRPAFLSDWRNVGLIALACLALLLLAVLTLGPDTPDQPVDNQAAGGKPSVAVLPLDNISGDLEQTYLADGIAEDVITLLSRNPRFFVIDRNSSFTYRGQAIDIRQVGEELGVRYVVEGSLRKIGDRLRVTVQLIDTTSGQHIWAEQYDRPYTEMYDLQDEITNGIATALGDEIFKAEIARARSASTENLDAWGLVMRASQTLSNWNKDSTKTALTLYRTALELDPDYALAKAELARTLCWRATNLWSDNFAEDLTEGYKLAEEVRLAAPNDPLVLFSVGACYGVTNRTEEAIRLLTKAVAHLPNHAFALAALGFSYTFDGQASLGLPYLEKALQLSPKSPYTYLYEAWRAMALFELKDYAESNRATLKALESFDGWWWPWANLAAARIAQGDQEGAIQALYDAKKREPGFSLAYFKKALAVVYKNKGENVLAVLEPIWPEDLLRSEEN